MNTSFSPRPILAVDKGELITSLWVLQPVKGDGEREGDLKNVRTSGKILATPLISHSAFAICVSAVNTCIWSFLAWFSMVRISYKHDDLGYSQESNCSFVVKYTWPCWYLFVTAKNLFRLTGWSFRTTKFFDQPSLPPPPFPSPPSSLAMRYSVTGMYIFWGSAVHMFCE